MAILQEHAIGNPRRKYYRISGNPVGYNIENPIGNPIENHIGNPK